MREIDHFVLLARNEATIAGWRDSLATHALADRIVAIVETRDPQKPLTLLPRSGGLGSWRITGLDRSIVLPLLSSASLPAACQWTALTQQIAGGLHAQP